jgi:hypothetical protein
MLKEDNSGFVIFPYEGRIFNRLETGKTYIYLVAFHPSDMTKQPYQLSKVKIVQPGVFVSDDVTNSNRKKDYKADFDDFIEEIIKDNELGDRYFPVNSGLNSIPMTSAVCIGWSDFTFETKPGEQWFATFRDLTNEGQKLYYSIKKLHNNKEVRILTFNNI